MTAAEAGRTKTSTNPCHGSEYNIQASVAVCLNWPAGASNILGNTKTLTHCPMDKQRLQASIKAALEEDVMIAEWSRRGQHP